MADFDIPKNLIWKSITNKDSLSEDVLQTCEWCKELIIDIISWEKICWLYWELDLNCFWKTKNAKEYIHKKNPEEVEFAKWINLWKVTKQIIFYPKKSFIEKGKWTIVLKIWDTIHCIKIYYNEIKKYRAANDTHIIREIFIEWKYKDLSREDLKVVNEFILNNIVNEEW